MSGSQLFGVDLSQTYATTSDPIFQVGSVHFDTLGRKWQFVKGAGTIAQYEYVLISNDGLFTVTSLTTTNVGAGKTGAVGCVQVSGGLTSTLYGWVFRGYGAHTGKFALNCAAQVPIHPTGTAGVVDDSAVTALIPGLQLVTTITTAAAAPAWAIGELMCVGI